MRGEKLADYRGALLGRRQVVQPELQKRLAPVGFAAGGLQQLLGVGEAHGDADARQRSCLRHERLE